MINVNVKITEDQAKKIKDTGLNRSEFIRRAIDYYNVEYQEKVLMDIIEFCNGKLKGKEMVKNNKEWVKNSKDGVKNSKEITPENLESKDILYQNKEKLYTNKDILYTNKAKMDEKHNNNRELPANEVASILAAEFGMIQRMLNNPDNADVIPDVTLNLLHKRYNISKKSIENFIFKHKKQLKQGNFE